MAIDPRIALGVNPPVIAPLQLRSPIEQLGKMLSLRNLMQENQSGELGLQAQQLKMEEARKGIAQEQSLQDFIVNNPNATPPQIIGAGGLTRGGAYLKSQADAEKARLDRLAQANTINVQNAKRRAQLAAGATDLESAKKLVWQGANEGVYDIDPAKNAQIARDTLEHLQKNGFIPDEWKAHAQESMDYAARQELADKTAEEKRKADEAAAKLPGFKADTAQKVRADNAAMLAGAMAQGPESFAAASAKLKPEDAAPFAGAKTADDVLAVGSTPHERITAAQAADTFRETKAQHAISNEIERARLGLSRQEQALRQRTFDSTYGALVDPNTGKAMEPEAAKAIAMQDPQAVGIANYQIAPVIARGGQGSPVMRKVMAINPDYNAQNWQAQGSMLKTFTSGKVANELRATNTALSHVGLLNDAIDALNNGDVRLLNQIGNRLGLETGKTPAAVFQTIVGKVGPELAQAYGEATGGERKGEKANFDPSLPPQTLRANAAVTAKLLAGKIGSTKFQWESTMGKRPLPMISPEAQGVLDKLGAGTGATGKGPPVGTVVDGHKFKGGDPNDQKNWEEVKK